MVQNIDSANKAKPSTSSSTETKPMSFEDYRKRKENDRSSKPKTGGKWAKVEKEVKIQVGLVKDKNGDGFLVRDKSRTITRAVGEDCDAATLLEKAVNKHAGHHKQFDKDCKYVLLYHDIYDHGKKFASKHYTICVVKIPKRSANPIFQNVLLAMHWGRF